MILGKAERKRSLDFLIMQCNLIGEYLDHHPEAFEPFDIDYLRPKLKEIKFELLARSKELSEAK